MKKLLSLILSLALILGAVSFTATTASAASGTWGGLSWTIDSRGILNISGTGEMNAFTSDSTSAWLNYKSSIKSVLINEGVTSVSAYAFYGCTSLTSAIIGDSVTSIGEDAFYKCTSLRSVTIGDSVTSIGNYAFSGCSSLDAVYISDLAAWCNIDFSGYSSNPLNNLYINGTLVTDLVIPDSVTSIRNYAFRICTSLTSVTIGGSVTSIGNYAFYYCDALDAVYISDIAAWCNISFGDSYSNPLDYANNLYLNGTLVTDLVIPDSVTSIRKYAFSGCTSLTSVTIPDSFTSIGSSTFSSCTSLTSVTIPDSVTSIGSSAFAGCTAIKKVNYCGNEIQWMQMYIDTGNDPLINAPVVYNYQVYVPFTFAEGADTANVAIDDTKGHLSFSAGGMTVENIKALFADENISFTKASGDAQTSGNVGTGTVITASRGDESKSYTIVVLGDLTGDGKVSSADYSKAVSAVKGKATLDGAFYAAANVVAPGTDKLAANDYAKIRSFIVNKIESF